MGRTKTMPFGGKDVEPQDEAVPTTQTPEVDEDGFSVKA